QCRRIDRRRWWRFQGRRGRAAAVSAIPPPDPARVAALEAALGARPDGVRLFALADASVNDALPARFYADHTLPFDCLLPGDLTAEVFRRSPFVADVTDHPEVLRWLLGGWGRAWATYALARSTLRELVYRLRPALDARAPDGVPMLFRFYDPRVLRVAAPVLTPAQQRTLLGTVEAFVCESLAPEVALRLSQGAAGAARAEVPLG
ncbi:MAG: DUF4123 domain-containing protein, partial [Burkholderiales bacterium]